MQHDRQVSLPADLDELRELEEAMWRSETRADHNWMDQHLAADFEEFGRSGRRYGTPTTASRPC